MDKQKLFSSIICSFIIGIFILISAVIIGNSITRQEPQELRYEFISRGAEIIIFDTKTGEYYTKFDMDNEAPHNWTKVENPFEAE